MPRSFEFELQQAPDELIGKLKNSALDSGWGFEGDLKSGAFEGDGIKGAYAYDGRTLTVTIHEKPFIAPWPLIENKLRDILA